MERYLSLTQRFASLSLLAALTLYSAGCATAPAGGKPLNQQATLAGEQLRKADRAPLSSPSAVVLSLSAAQNALTLAADKSAAPAVREQGTRIYNAAVAKCVLALQKQPPWPEGQTARTFTGNGAAYQVRVVTQGEPSLKNPAKYTRLIDSTTIFRKHLKSDVERTGLGASLVGVTENSEAKTPNQPHGGFAEPLTAVATFQKSRRGSITAQISFRDPRLAEKVTADGTSFPLKGDFTAQPAYFPRVRPLIFGIVAMLRSDRVAARSGIYFVEPYNPNKIPILFVHGLMSSPHAWINFINELNRDPDFRRRYQPWVYFYPSGGPIAGNAIRLRRDLAEVAKRYQLKHNLVVVGHSMGGILTQMQITKSERTLWDTVFGSKADTFYKMFSEKSLLKQALIFDANPYIRRVIFIATPHRGSNLANLGISALVGRLIKMPATLVTSFDPQTRAAVRDISPSLRSVPSSIIGLSPKSPLLKGVDKLTIAVPYYSIIGNQGKDNIPLAKSSDGIVPYWSSHMDGAQSELIVPTGHDAFDNEKSVKEVLRILALKE